MNKIEQIKAEIDRRYAEYRAKMKTDDFTYYEGMADALDLFEQFINSLPEEKPSEDLEEAADNYIAPIENEEGLYYFNFAGRDIRDAFIAGTEWGAEHARKQDKKC